MNPETPFTIVNRDHNHYWRVHRKKEDVDTGNRLTRRRKVLSFHRPGIALSLFLNGITDLAENGAAY